MVSQSQPLGRGESAATSGAEPSVSDWTPKPDTAPMVRLPVMVVGSRSLKTRRPNPKRGRIGGKRYVAMWRVKGDDTFVIEFGAGKHKQVLRLSGDALDAIEELHDLAKGNPTTWKLIYRVVANTAAAKTPAVDAAPTETALGADPKAGA